MRPRKSNVSALLPFCFALRTANLPNSITLVLVGSTSRLNFPSRSTFRFTACLLAILRLKLYVTIKPPRARYPVVGRPSAAGSHPLKYTTLPGRTQHFSNLKLGGEPEGRILFSTASDLHKRPGQVARFSHGLALDTSWLYTPSVNYPSMKILWSNLTHINVLRCLPLRS